MEASRSLEVVPQDASATADDLFSAFASIRRSARLAGRPAELANLTGAQLDLVRLVRRRPNVSVAEAAAELRLAPNSVSTLVRQLTDSGLLVRRVDAADRRIARLELTPDTAREVGRFRDRRVALLASAIAELRPADRRRLEVAVPILAGLAARLPDLVETDA
jgi:DNA-binding MarR family transcriptional regulator